MKAEEIERVNVARVLESVAERGAKTETNRHQALISAVLKWAMSEGYLDKDASHGLKRRFDESARTRVFTDDELRNFWYGIERAPALKSTKIAMRLCFVLGQRPKEIAHLRQSRLSLEGEKPTATIEKTTSKNRVEHIVPLPARAVELLLRALALAPGSEWVFPSPTNNGPIDPHTLSSVVQRSRDPNDNSLFGIIDAQLYDSKKTIATFLGDAGHPDQVIGLLFNHRTAKEGTVTGKHYNHSTYIQAKRDLTEQWSQHLDRVLGPPRVYS